MNRLIVTILVVCAYVLYYLRYTPTLDTNTDNVLIFLKAGIIFGK